MLINVGAKCQFKFKFWRRRRKIGANSPCESGPNFASFIFIKKYGSDPPTRAKHQTEAANRELNIQVFLDIKEVFFFLRFMWDCSSEIQNEKKNLKMFIILETLPWSKMILLAIPFCGCHSKSSASVWRCPTPTYPVHMIYSHVVKM